MKLFIFYMLSVVFTATTQAAERGRMFKSNAASAKQFPYMVRIDMFIGDWSTHCTGTLVGDQWVVTAGHCMDFDGVIPDRLKINMGSSIKNKGEVSVDVSPAKKYIHFHPTYNKTGELLDDLVMIKIPKVTFNDKIKAASINYQKQSHVGKTVTVAGWGSKTDKIDFPNVQQWNTFTVIENSICEMYFEKIMPGQFCVENSISSICPGDSGGPCFYGSGIPQLLGTASYISNEGCEMGYPMVFTYMPYYKNWMNDVMKKYSSV